MISRGSQRLISLLVVVVAFGALILGAFYQDDNRLDQPSYVGVEKADADAASANVAVDDSGIAVTVSDSESTLPDIVPVAAAIEGFLPAAGAASACHQPVGVDLAPGYGASLAINGQSILAEQMNVNLEDSGAISDVITASRSVGKYTFKPDSSCPNGTYLRPLDNLLEVCVYKLSDSSKSCAISSQYVFDAS